MSNQLAEEGKPCPKHMFLEEFDALKGVINTLHCNDRSIGEYIDLAGYEDLLNLLSLSQDEYDFVTETEGVMDTAARRQLIGEIVKHYKDCVHCQFSAQLHTKLYGLAATTNILRTQTQTA